MQPKSSGSVRSPVREVGEVHMSNMRGRDYFSLIVKGKNHAERIISTIEDTE